MSRFDFRRGGLPDGVEVVAVRGREAMSELYGFEVFVVTGENACAELDLDSVIGAAGTLEIKERADATEVVPYHGIVAEADLLHVANGMGLLRVVVVPEVWKLTQSRHSRVLTDVSVKDVIEKVLGEAGLAAPFELKLKGSHPTEEHICQYRESDFDFLARWMEREGIFFYFVHEGDGPEKLVISDDNTRPSLGAVRFAPTASGDTSAGMGLRSFRALASALPANIVLRDYDYARPALDVSSRRAVASEGGEVVIFEERSFDPGDAERLAKLRAEQRLAEQQRLRGVGTVFGMRPGHAFELEEHPRLSRGYVVVAAGHEGSQGHALLTQLGLQFAPGYQVEVTCGLDDVAFRPEQRTAWPRIRGYQLGLVEGASDSDYAQLDDQGRYVVKLMFDEGSASGEAVSTRIRMMQPHAGSPEGWHFPLRKGTEVVVQFVGGDPDRPVIAGAVPNAHNPSPVTSANQTQNVLQTGGVTRLEVEDQSGKQYIWVHTPPADTYMNLGHPTLASHHITLHSDKDCLYDIGSNQLIEVGGELDEQVTGDVTETYKANQDSTISGPQTTTVTGDVSETYLGSQSTTVTKAPREELFNNGQSTLVMGARQETYTGGQLQQVFGTTGETWVGGWTRTVTGATSEYHDGTLTEVILGSSSETFPAGVTETYGPTNALWASLLKITPKRTLIAPTMKITYASKLTTKVTEQKIDPVQVETKLTDTGCATLKLESNGVTAAVQQLKMEANALDIRLSGVTFNKGGLKIKLTPFYLTTVGIRPVT